MRTSSRWILAVSVLAMMVACTHNSRAQLSLSVGTPDVSNFPQVQLGVWITENGKPATLISSGNFTLREDGIPGTILGLNNCGGSSSAAIAFVVDTSQSMDANVGSGPAPNRNYYKFFDAFSQFLTLIPGPSSIALVPFADTSKSWYPGTPNNFWNSSITNDTTRFTTKLQALKFNGTGTDVDAGVLEGAKVLALSTLPRKVMILVTDAATTDEAGEIQYLKANNVTLFVVDVGHDTHVDLANKSMAEATGGEYFQAPDTLSYASAFAHIAQFIFSEHCTLLYQSNTPCPAWKTHRIDVTVNYRGNQQTATAYYELGRSPHDTLAPRFALDTASFISRVIHSYDYFPCESGMRSLQDSELINFRRTNASMFASDSASDSIAVIDSLHAADAYYLATDSAGNTSRYHIHYEPRPDTIAPQIGTPAWSGNGAFTVDITDVRAWDRGVQQVVLAAGAINFVLDSVAFNRWHTERAYLHLGNPLDSGEGCIIATDSAGNRRISCIPWYGDVADFLPPLYTQDPIAEPRIAITGTVTEKRLNDRGIKSVAITPITNISTSTITFIDRREANIRVALIDSMYPGLAILEAIDSVTNRSIDSILYEPVPDTIPPNITYSTTGTSSYLITATEIHSWDRGLTNVTLLANSINATASPVTWIDARHATIAVAITDRTKAATIVIDATDSAGNVGRDTILFQAIPLTPLGDVSIDFGRVPATTVLQRTIGLSNGNDIPFSATLVPVQGNDSVFSYTGTSPLTFSKSGSQNLTFEFHPQLVGYWQEKYILLRDTATLSTITLRGQSIATLKLALDTVDVAAPGAIGNLKLSIDALPKPINLDTISFRLAYDPNVITLLDPQACNAIDTTICLYDMKWSGTDGDQIGLLIRRSSSRSATLNLASSAITIPFISYLSLHDTTPVLFAAYDTSLLTFASMQNGLVRVGERCGDETIRAAMAGRINLSIQSISPNPASSTIQIQMKSVGAMDASIRLYGSTGEVAGDFPVHLNAGINAIVLPTSTLSSGTYELIVRERGLDCARTKIEIVH